MTERRTWEPRYPDDVPPWWWLAQKWHWLWRQSGLISDREQAYGCAFWAAVEEALPSDHDRA